MQLLKFYTDNCYPCEMMKPIVQDVLDDINIPLYNIIADSWEAEIFNVRAVPTLILMKDGKEIKRTQGIMGYQALKKWIEEERQAFRGSSTVE